jgi:hypothetical protein
VAKNTDLAGNTGSSAPAPYVLATGATPTVIENWENPVLASGTTSAALPSPWALFSNNGSYEVVNSPTALPSPADGHQYLDLNGTNTGIAEVTDIVISANTTYTLSAAIGHVDASYGNSWSIQLWADTNGNNVFDGSAHDTFIGQQFATSGTASNPANGVWTSNAFTFDSASTPNLVGNHLIVFLNNYLPGSSFYDSIAIAQAPDAPLTLVNTGNTVSYTQGGAAATVAPNLAVSDRRVQP